MRLIEKIYEVERKYTEELIGRIKKEGYVLKESGIEDIPPGFYPMEILKRERVAGYYDESFGCGIFISNLETREGKNLDRILLNFLNRKEMDRYR